MKQLFVDGPFEELTATADEFVVETDVQRLLKWGAAPAPSNDHNADLMLDAVKRLADREAWYGMNPARFLRLILWIFAKNSRKAVAACSPHAFVNRLPIASAAKSRSSFS
jgi:hypothetical protein